MLERIQDCYCLKCGRIGHARKECNFPMVVSLYDLSIPRYKPDLGVNRAEPLSSIEEEFINEEGEQQNIMLGSKSEEEFEKMVQKRKAWVGESGSNVGLHDIVREKSSQKVMETGIEKQISRIQLSGEDDRV
ncbi:hypothetical protein PIB30_081157 [Stylosanthes scabra]|uniref:CCHC-type domain-containing protein n=1 Tax=Stylosanthes scabra TaxID=79078 RepID=A0ABU6YTG5_9FABA|nr:hypothetical protein [Stylosanthes scabra]